MNTLAPEHPRAQKVDFDEDQMVVTLDDGRVISVPLEWFARLRDTTKAERANWRLIGGGVGIHFPAIDEDISIRGLLVP